MVYAAVGVVVLLAVACLGGILSIVLSTLVDWSEECDRDTH